MPVPQGCENAEKSFQDAVNTFPDLPATIGGGDAGLLWSQVKRDMIARIQSSHTAYVISLKHPDANDIHNMIFDGLNQSLRVIDPLYDGSHRFGGAVLKYARTVNDAHKSVINCIKILNIPRKKVKRSQMGWDDPITSKRMKNRDRAFRLDGKDTMIFLADNDGLAKWLTTRNTNPLTNQPPTSKEEIFLDIEEDAGEPPAEGGRRKTRKYKRRAKKTRRRNK